MRQTYRRHRRKTGIPLLISYLIRGGGVLLVVLCVAVLVWGGVSLFGHTDPEPDQLSSGSADPSPEPGTDASLPAAASNPGPTQDPVPVSDPEPAVQVVIDAGHGGKDPGSSCEEAVEKDIALQLALLLQQKLEAEGITTLMTREGDDNITMAERVALANQAQAQLYISLHCNSYEEDARVMGLECYYWQSDESLALARTITQQVGQAGIKTREVKTEEYVVLRDSEMPAVLIETGFITNDQDRERLTNPDSQSVLMDAVTKAVKATLDRMAA